jgi:hypothetical protein
MTFAYRHDSWTFTTEIHRIGPAIQVLASLELRSLTCTKAVYPRLVRLPEKSL